MLMSNVYPSFQELVNRAIVIDNKRKEMDAKKRKIQGQASSSNTRPCVFPQQGFPPRNQRPPSQWNQGQYPPRNQNQNQQRPHYQQQLVINALSSKLTTRHHVQVCPTMLQ